MVGERNIEKSLNHKHLKKVCFFVLYTIFWLVEPDPSRKFAASWMKADQV